MENRTWQLEQELNLWDLCFFALKYWRWAIVAVLLGGFVCGLYSYKQSVDDIANYVPPTAVTAESLTEAQHYKVNNVFYYEKMYHAKKEYYDNSILMQLDANNVWQVDLIYFVGDYAEYCKSELETAAFYTTISSKYGDSSDASELVEITASEDGFLTVCLLAESEERAIVISDITQKYMEGLGVRDYSAELVKESISETAREDVLLLQEECLVDMINYQSRYTSNKDALSEIEKAYYELKVNGKENEHSQSEYISGVSPSVNKGLVFVGIVFFCFLYMMVVFVLYIMNNKLRSCDDMYRTFGISQLGEISLPQEKKRIFGFVDSWIIKMRDYGKSKLSFDEAINVLEKTVLIATSKYEIKKLCFVGFGTMQGMQKVCVDIKDKYAEKGIDVEILSDIIRNAEALQKLEEMEGAILFETVGVSIYKDICREIELLESLHIKVMGCVKVQ